MAIRLKFHKPYVALKGFRLHRPLKPTMASSEAERLEFYSSTKWKRCREAFLASHPLCAECLRNRRLTDARIVHHKVERLHDPVLSFDWDNLEAMCKSCHTRLHKRVKP